ncbi:MAG TPA: glycosyltransferase family 2 protein, partial [Dehalococcoidia bacterium]|nr:glycosyltransferase family 2 protein [Dehalococcoidia bacterium]
MPAIDELGRKGRTASPTFADGQLPFVSVVVPLRNEGEHIGRCLDALQRQDYPAHMLEVIAVDGVSTDDTRDVVRSRLPGTRIPIRLLGNPGVTAARGLNIGIREANGGVIIILGGHSEVALDFVSRSVDALWRSEADVVGGRIESVARGAAGEAIAIAMSSPFGVGDARFRTSDSPGFVDTVAFGAYRREVFDRIGLFDEDLERNVDDEFNYRLREAGGHIYLNPAIRSRYYTR